MELSASRRDLLLASLLTTLPLGLGGAAASPIDPAQTIIKLPADLQWKANPNNPPRSSESCLLTGDTTQPGLYFTLVRWWPDYMSAPHTYTSDRLHGPVGHLVVQQRCRFRPRRLRAGPGWQPCPPRRRHAAL
jgi:hypothetical protein